MAHIQAFRPRRLRLIAVFTCLLLAGQAAWVHAEVLLKYNIVGLTGTALENARAYLGPPPDSEEDRANFVYFAGRDVERSLNALGFYQPLVTVTVNRDSIPWRMLIEVVPGEPVTFAAVDVRVEGEAREDPAFSKLLKSNPLVVGARLDHGVYENFKTRLQTLGQQRGYIEGRLVHSRVSVDAGAGSARVEIHYDSGPRYHFGEVTIDEFPLNERHFDNMISFHRGDLFDLTAIQDSQVQLQRAGYFGSALVRPGRPDRESLEIPVHVELTPNTRHSYRVGLGYSTDTRERISFAWHTPLINRFGHRQETRLEYSPVRPRGSFIYTIPLGHPVDDILQLRTLLERNEYGDLESEQRGAGVNREWRLGKWTTTIHLRYLHEKWDILDDNKSSEYWLPGFAFSRRDSEGNALDPSSGFSQFYSAEFGLDQAGSAADLARFYGSWRYVMTPWDRHRLVSRLEAGAVFFEDDRRPDLAPSLSFFAGGSQSIRGFGYQSLGPTVNVAVGDETRSLVVGGDRLLVGSIEYQYYVTPQWRPALFVDAGNAFDSGDYEPEAGAGVGVHYVSPIGAVRLDLAKGISEGSSNWRIHLTVGAEF